VRSGQGQEKIMPIFQPGDAFGGLLLGLPYGSGLPWVEAIKDYDGVRSLLFRFW